MRSPNGGANEALDADQQAGYASTATGGVFHNSSKHRPDVWDCPDMQRMWMEMVQWTMGIIPGDADPRPLRVMSNSRTINR